MPNTKTWVVSLQHEDTGRTTTLEVQATTAELAEKGAMLNLGRRWFAYDAKVKT